MGWGVGRVALLVLVAVASCDSAGKFTCTKLEGALPVRYLKTKSDEVTVRASLFRAPDGKGFVLKKDVIDKSAVAWGEHRDAVQTIGFGVMSIHSNSKFDAEAQMFAAGYLEGYLTNDRIRQMYKNARELRNQQLLGKVYEYMEHQSNYLLSKVAATPGDAYWQHVGHVLTQLKGLVEGYNDHAAEGQKLTAGDIWLLNMDGDVLDVERMFEGGHASAPNVLTGMVGGVDDGAQLERFRAVAETTVDVHDEALVEDRAQVHTQAKTKQHRYDEREWNSLMERSMGMRFRERVATIQATRKKVGGGQVKQSRRFDETEWKRQVQGDRCSAVVTLAEDSSNFFVGHTTWSDYAEMLRLYKHYELPLGPDVVLKQSFSGYPGMISSTDDWYMLSSNIMILETTMNVENEGLYEKLDPGSQVVSWVRTLVSNRLAKTGVDWSKMYARHNSGTYNCMWLIFDLNQFIPQPNQGPQPGFFTMTEQIPGMVVTKDMTDELKRRRYFPSVNRPYFKNIRAAAGYPEDNADGQGNDFFSFENNPRGRMFASRHGTVKDLDSLGHLLRYNGWNADHASSQYDGACLGKPGHAISARFDLPGEDAPRPVGGTDSKITDYHTAMKMQSKVLTGPTTENQAPFRWTGAGVPATFNDPVRGKAKEGEKQRRKERNQIR